MKHFTDAKRAKMAEPMNKIFPLIDKILKDNGLTGLHVKELSLAPTGERLVCGTGYHEETFCDHTGRCFKVCVKDI